MKALIGVETLRKLPKGARRHSRYELRGFVLRVRPSGVHTYFANYARGKWKLLGTTQVLTPPEAREAPKAVLGDAMARPSLTVR
jgi:Arm DNA-binding domain